MATAFAKAFAAFDLRMDEFNRHATRASDEMRERVLISRQLCNDSRELIAKVDGLLQKGRRSWRRE
jgi:hypothetical protein